MHYLLLITIIIHVLLIFMLILMFFLTEQTKSANMDFEQYYWVNELMINSKQCLNYWLQYSVKNVTKFSGFVAI